MRLSEFNKGLSTRLAPHLISAANSVVCKNVDVEPGTLKPVANNLELSTQVDKYFTYSSYNNTYISTAVNTDFIEYNDIVYMTDGVQPRRYNRSKQYRNLGIENPASAPSIFNTSAARPIRSLSVTNKTSSGNLPDAPLAYLLVNVKNGIYSKPLLVKTSLISSDLAVDTELLDISSETELYQYVVKNFQSIGKQSATTRFIEFTGLIDPIADSARLYRLYDGDWRFLKEFTSPSTIFSDSVYDISAATKFDFTKLTAFNGTYQYVYTYYNSLEDIESAPSAISSELYLDSGSIYLTGISASSDVQVDKKHIYRVGGQRTVFTKVATIENGDTNYTDSISDLNLGSSTLSSQSYYAPPSNLSYIKEAYSMLFGASGSSLRFTPIDKPNAWPPEYSIVFNGNITGIAVVSTGLLVFIKHKTYLITGNAPESLNVITLDENHGCIAHKSISEISNGSAIWASSEGLCISTGTEVKQLTKNSLGKLTLNPENSAVYNEVYYCLDKDGTLLVVDYRYGLVIYNLDLSISNIVFTNGKLLGIDIGGKLVELFKGDGVFPMSYKSPVFTDALEKIANGSLIGVNIYTEFKTYKKVYISYTGIVNFKIYIDGKVASETTLDNTALSSPITSVVQVPHFKQRGYSIQFELTGTGEVFEIQYDPGDRKND